MHATWPLIVAVLFGISGGACAQSGYPSKPVRLIVASAAGGQPDMVARLIAQKLNEAWGYPIVVDNRPAAAGVVAASAVAKAVPDGYTLLYTPPNLAINAVTVTKLPYDTFKDLVPVVHVGISTNVLVASPALGAKSLKEFIAIARSRPDKLILVNTAGSAAYLSGARFNLLTGISALHVPFKSGTDAMIDVVAGRAHYHVGTMGSTLPFIKEKKLVALAVTSPQRSPILPEVPALGEVLVEFARPETSHGILAPAGTPRPIVMRINGEIVRILGLLDIRDKLAGISYVIAPSTPEEFAGILRAQVEALAKIVRDAGVEVR
jgi:tripartite-type tricarboxylate transporter receptor subunit TctC